MKSSLYINFATAVITLILGILLLTGVLFPINNNAMIMFGVVLIIYGIYRFVTSVSKIRLSKLEEKGKKISEEKEKFLDSL
jgi:uncharacterized membrane protein HdeD (DUF308 family)